MTTTVSLFIFSALITLWCARGCLKNVPPGTPPGIAIAARFVVFAITAISASWTFWLAQRLFDF